MNKQILIVLVLIFNNMNQKSNCSLVQELEANLFHDINNNLQISINKIFTLLKLNKTFSDDRETQLHLSMFASLKGVSEKKYKFYKDLINLSRLDSKFHQLKYNGLFKLDKHLEKMMAEDFKIPLNTRKSINRELNNSIEIPDNSEEAFILLRDHLINVENVELADIAKPSSKLRKIYKKHKKFRRARRGNFKLWKLPNNSEQFSSDTRRLFNGVHTSIKSFPFVASVHVKDKFICTGAIISRDMIITAASCLHELHYNPKILETNPRKLAVRVGSDFPDRDGDYILASYFFIHPEYEVVTLKNNLAIIRIKKHMHLRNKDKIMRRIDFQRKIPEFPTGKHDIVILGWGKKDEDETEGARGDTNPLSRSRLELMPILEDCIKVYTKKYVREQNFCAGVSDTGAGACQRDIGGPAVFGSLLIGVVSFGPLVCGTPDSPTVFSHVGKYSYWIDRILKIVNKGSVNVTSTTTTMISPTTLEPVNNKRFKVVEQEDISLIYTVGQITSKEYEETGYNKDVQRVADYKKVSNEMSSTTKTSKIEYETQSEQPKSVISNVLNKFPKAIELLTSALNQLVIGKDNVNSEDDTKIRDNEKDESKNLYRQLNDSRYVMGIQTKIQDNNKEKKFKLTADNSLENLQPVTGNSQIDNPLEKSEDKEYEERNEGSSDYENYESKNGLSIEETTEFARETSPKLLNNPEVLKEKAQLMIKDFVQNKLAPMRSQLGLDLRNDFREKAERFLIEHFVNDELTSVDNTPTRENNKYTPEQEFDVARYHTNTETEQELDVVTYETRTETVQESDVVTYETRTETQNEIEGTLPISQKIIDEYLYVTHLSPPPSQFQPNTGLVEVDENIKKITTKEHTKFRFKITPPQRHTGIYSDEVLLKTVNVDDVFKNVSRYNNQPTATDKVIQALLDTDDHLEKEIVQFKKMVLNTENGGNFPDHSIAINDSKENYHENLNVKQKYDKDLRTKQASKSNTYGEKVKDKLILQNETTTERVNLGSFESIVSVLSKKRPIFKAELYDEDQDQPPSFRSQDVDTLLLIDKLMSTNSSQELRTVNFDQYHQLVLENFTDTQETYEV